MLEKTSNNYFGQYTIYGGIILDVTTSVDYQGQLKVNNFDEDNFIISGTFEFTVLDDDGNEIKITDGRFDMNYTN